MLHVFHKKCTSGIYAPLTDELSGRVRDYLNYLEDVPSATDFTYEFLIFPVEQKVESVAEFMAAFWRLMRPVMRRRQLRRSRGMRQSSGTVRCSSPS